MKQWKILIFALVFLFLFGMVACSSKTGPTQPGSNSSTIATATLSAADTQQNVTPNGAATPTIDVDALIREKLQNHHDIERIYGAHHTRDEWNATLDRMISYGANISDAEKQIIIDYLMKHQP
jgi:hypothetical protein